VTEIDLGLDLLWRAGVKPDKVIMGFGWVSALSKLTGRAQDRSLKVVLLMISCVSP
jgi:chitinase